MLFASGMCRVVVVTELQLETVATVALAQFSENPFCFDIPIPIYFYILCKEVCVRTWLSTYI